MSESSLKIQNLINLDNYIKNSEEYNHLFEVQLPPDDINIWKIRSNFDMGTIMVGDLLLDLEKEANLEIHPFPEWVVHLRSKGVVNSKPYLIVPNFSKSVIKKIKRKPIEEKIVIIKDEVKKLKIEDLIAFEYDLGINIMVPAFIPHFFIASKINKEKGGSPPYLQVFEPNIGIIAKNLNIKPTYFFKLPFTVIV